MMEEAFPGQGACYWAGRWVDEACQVQDRVASGRRRQVQVDRAAQASPGRREHLEAASGHAQADPVLLEQVLAGTGLAEVGSFQVRSTPEHC